MIKRRDFITLLGGNVVIGSLALDSTALNEK